MPDGETAQRLSDLLSQSEALRVDGQTQDANAALREAVVLAPDDTRVRAAIAAVPSSESAADILALCSAYINSKDEQIRQRVVSTVRQAEFSVQDATAALSLLLEQKDENLSASAQGRIIGAVCSRPNGAKSLASMIHNRPTETFRQFWSRDAAENIVQTLIRRDVWDTSDDQTNALKQTFLLFLAKLVEPDEEHHEDAMRSVAKLMAAHAGVLAPLVDDENMAIILSYLDVDRPTVLKSQATLAVAKTLETSPERVQEMLKQYVIARFGMKSNDDAVAAISVAGAIFPIVPAFAAKLFLTPGFVEDLVRIARQSRSNRLRQAILELLSAACIDKDCRATLFKTCASWIDETRRANINARDTAMAGLILSKLRQEYRGAPKSAGGNEDTLDDLVPMFKQLVLNSGEPEIQTSIEGLAYNSMDPDVKEQLANDRPFLDRLVKVIAQPSNRGPLLFGGLTILSNLTTYPAALSAEEKRIAQLKAYANQTRLPEPSLLDDEEHVAARCRKVLDVGVASLLLEATKKASPVTLNLVSMIYNSLSKARQHCRTMVQQGMFDTIVRLAHMDQEDASGILPHARTQSAQAMARVLISVDPGLLFARAERDVQRCIGPLNFLLSREEPSDPQYAFDGLRALTNIAGLNEHSARLISDNCFTSIEVYLESTRSAQQQAATECVCNLSYSDYFLLSHYVLDPSEGEPYGPAFDADAPSANRKETLFLRLIWLVSAKARGTRIAAMAALATAASTEPGRRMLMRAPDGLEHVIAALTDAQSVEAGEAAGLKGDEASVGDLDMRLRAACVIHEVCCNTDDVEVLGRMVRHGVMKLMTEGAKHLPSDEQAKAQLLGYTEPIKQKLKDAFRK